MKFASNFQFAYKRHRLIFALDKRRLNRLLTLQLGHLSKLIHIIGELVLHFT